MSTGVALIYDGAVEHTFVETTRVKFAPLTPTLIDNCERLPHTRYCQSTTLP